MTLTPSTRQLSPDASHSLSGSHRRDRHAARTWMARARFVTAPKRVITREADLLYSSIVNTGRWRFRARPTLKDGSG